MNEKPRKSATQKCDTDVSNTLSASATRELCPRNESGRQGRIKNDPASSARQRLAGSNQPSPRIEQGKADVTIASIERPSDIESRDRMLGELDYIRDLVESSRMNRVRLMMKARHQGWSCHDIGVALGITEDAVRKAIKRAGDLD